MNNLLVYLPSAKWNKHVSIQVGFLVNVISCFFNDYFLVTITKGSDDRVCMHILTILCYDSEL